MRSWLWSLDYRRIQRAVAQTLYAMLAVLEIIGRRQDSPASCRGKKKVKNN
jgi:hypothetical protein